ncbi:FAD-dependent oxidoreductase [Pseudooceanicola sp.]|uniref:NAD(P)/FAD-dependent oxidoreductase n=1 Tax=Pseudooceanicola sp. TaxID=1914328 RepID=UPI00261D0D57|nr:FAD-dependent oxidoreductase [Pseudooceanicola sp.]MDF1856339.1 FAD-dependent oxidoreductase [Pseudooceanicola sp.]
MKRPYGHYAYSLGPIRKCAWTEEIAAVDLQVPTASGMIIADFAIIGGGYTGLNAALALAEAGADVALFDAEFPGFGASGRNGGFCCIGGARASDAQLERRHGRGAAAEVRQAEMAAVAHVATLIDRLGLDVDRHSEGEAMMAHSPAKFEALRRAQPEIDRRYGVKTRLIEASALAEHGLNSGFHGALILPVGFALHPRKYLAGLVAAAKSAGARLFGDSPVTAIAPAAEGFRLTTPQASIRARRLLISTNGYSAENLPPWLRHRFLPAQSSMLATRVMSPAELAAQGWTSPQMAYEDRRLLHYFHLTPDNRMVFGQRGGLIASQANDARIAQKVRADFDRLFPAWRAVETPHHWSGMVCLTASLTPFCGAIPELPGAFAAFGYHGNGVAMGSYCGKALADLALGSNGNDPDRVAIPRAFAAPPPRFPLGPLRRAWLAAEYGWARLTDR